MPPRPEVLTVDAGDELRLHVEQYPAVGARPSWPLVMLHGFTGSTRTWDPLREALGDAITTVSVDLPGHGKSSVPRDPKRYALERLADDLALVLDRIGADRATVLGYSFGGRAALKLALRHPGRVAALVLESTSPGIESPADRKARTRGDVELAELLERQGVTAFLDRWEALPLWASQRSLDEESRTKLRTQRLAQSAAGLANALRGAGAGEDPAVLDRLGELDMPALLIAGALDARYVDHALAMARRMPRSRVEIVPDAGHAVHLERPGEYARIVASFTAGVRSQE